MVNYRFIQNASRRFTSLAEALPELDESELVSSLRDAVGKDVEMHIDGVEAISSVSGGERHAVINEMRPGGQGGLM